MSASENRMKIAALGQAFAAMAPGTWGERAGTNLGNYAQALAEKEAQKEAEAKEKSGIFGKAGGALGAIVGTAFGGPVGGMIGGSLGSAGGQALGGGGVNMGSVIGTGATGAMTGIAAKQAAPVVDETRGVPVPGENIDASFGAAIGPNVTPTAPSFFQRLGPAFQAYGQAVEGGNGAGFYVAPPINGYIDANGRFVQYGGGV